MDCLVTQYLLRAPGGDDEGDDPERFHSELCYYTDICNCEDHDHE